MPPQHLALRSGKSGLARGRRSNRGDDQPLTVRRQIELRIRSDLEKLQNGLVDDDARTVANGPKAASSCSEYNIVITPAPVRFKDGEHAVGSIRPIASIGNINHYVGVDPHSLALPCQTWFPIEPAATPERRELRDPNSCTPALFRTVRRTTRMTPRAETKEHDGRAGSMTLRPTGTRALAASGLSGARLNRCGLSALTKHGLGLSNDWR